MKKTVNPRASRAAQKQLPAWPTASQALRQIGLILLVLVIWAALLVVYENLIGGSARPAAGLPQPTSPAPASTPAPGAAVSFSKDMLPLFNARCVSCHGPGVLSAGLDLSSYAGVLAGSRSGAVVVPSSAATSRLVDAISTGRMPLGGPKLSATEIETIQSWVNAGAPDN